MRALEDGPRLARLREVRPGVVGGLVVAGARGARDRTAAAPRDRDDAIWAAVVEGLRAALAGDQPAERVHRLPAWVVASMRRRLRRHEFYWLDTAFLDVRTIELLGLAELEVDDDYVLSMLTGLLASRSWEEDLWGDPVEWFRVDPDLVERAYWRAYEIEGEGVVSLRVEAAGPDGAGWRPVTLRMISEGMISRDRVVDACFAALDRDFSPAASRWFVQLLGDLALADEELAARQPAIRRHLTHLSPAVVRNALAWLGRLDRRLLLDDEETAPALEAAVLAPTKATATAALNLLRSLHGRTPSADVVTPARMGLTHARLDVQRSAADLLRSVGAADVVLAEADQLQPSVQAELGLLTPAEPLSVGPPPGPDPTPRAGPTAPRAATGHDVTERLAALLERADDPLEIELVLDALGRGGRTDRLTPLVKRARTVLAANEYHRLEQQLAALVLASTGTQAWPSVPQHPWALFLHRRLDEVRRVLDGTAPASPRLAAPTSVDGGLEPAVLVERVLHADLADHRVDLIAALLRLGPEGRPDARQTWEAGAHAVPPSVDRAVRHALGADPVPGTRPDDAALWVAASRARSPLADDPHLLDHGIDGPGRGRGLHATVSYPRSEGKRHIFDDEEHHLALAYGTAERGGGQGSVAGEGWNRRNKRARFVDQPTAVRDLSSQDAWDDDLGWLDHAWASWHATTWPGDAEHYASAVVVPTFQARRWTAADSTPRDVLATIRRHPGRLGATVAATLALTMAAGTTQTRVHAADAVVDLVTRERLTPDALAQALAASAPCVVVSRWRDTLERVSVAGGPHLTTAILTAVLPALPPSQHGLHALVDLLHQDLVRTGAVVTDPVLRRYLATMTGSSRTAVSARAVLALPATG